MRITVLALAATAALAAPAAAQHEGHAQHAAEAKPGAAKASLASRLPAGWTGRFDRDDADAATLAFSVMEPGWHITSGPAGIYYRADDRATGNFRVESTIFLFEASNHPEGYGVFVGGDHLETKGQSYLYFLVRQDGKYLIKRRNGPVTTPVREWTAHPAVARPVAGSDSPARNVLAVEAGADRVDFFVNGQKVESLPRAELDVDGVFGLRINHRLNLHVSELKRTGPGTRK